MPTLAGSTSLPRLLLWRTDYKEAYARSICMNHKIGSNNIEIKQAIQKTQANIKWLKRRLVMVSNSSYGKQAVLFYSQKIETQEALIQYLSQHHAMHQ
jgi:hypothetical protein